MTGFLLALLAAGAAGWAFVHVLLGRTPWYRTAAPARRARARWVGVGACGLLVLAIGLAAIGPANVHLDTARAAPAKLAGLVFIPAILSATGAVFVAIPGVVRVNAVVFVAMLTVAEAGAGLVPSGEPPIRGEPESVNQPTFYVDDPLLGTAILPNNVARHVKHVGDEVEYDVTYEIDRLGRRTTPWTSATPATESVLFFGGSNTFGEGLGQTDTLPYWFGATAAGYRPYNYSAPGWGPTQALEIVRTRDLSAEVEAPATLAFFFFIPGHVGRVVGSSAISTQWGRHYPCYGMTADGRLVRHGDFVHGRRLRTLVYAGLRRSHLLALTGAVWPLHYSDHDLALTAAVLQALQHHLQEQFAPIEFYVLFAPAVSPAGERLSERVMRQLEKADVPYLNLLGLVDMSDPAHRLHRLDFHDSGLTNRLVAEALVDRLNLATAAAATAWEPVPPSAEGTGGTPGNRRTLKNSNRDWLVQNRSGGKLHATRQAR